MKLFLSGGGGGEDSILLDKMFTQAVDTSKPILYIPIAIDKTKHPLSDCYNWLSSTLNPLGIDKIEMWDEKDIREKTNTDLEKFSGIYIGGGNTFYLLKELRESGFISKLENLINKDIPIYGGSAGAIIFAKTIISALSADHNDVGLTNFDALNKIKNYDLWCHYTGDMIPDILEYKDKYNLEKIIALPENAGLYITDEKIEEVGPGKVDYF